MLTRFDELTCHQVVRTFDSVETTDRAWTEKLWCNVHDTAGELVLATGFGIYPNRNVLDGYACVNVGNRRQHNLRASRELRPRLDEVAVGPLSYEVLEPWRRVRLTCGDNPRGIRFELEFEGRFARRGGAAGRPRLRPHLRQHLPLRPDGQGPGLDRGRGAPDGPDARPVLRPARPLLGRPHGRGPARTGRAAL
jgi:hypothetical protein